MAVRGLGWTWQRSQPDGLGVTKQAERTGVSDPGVWVLSSPKPDGSSASPQGLDPAAGRGRPGLEMTLPAGTGQAFPPRVGTWGFVGGWQGQWGTSGTGR